MNVPIQKLTDQELLQKTKTLAEKERELLTEVLRHLQEVERRKLFSDLGYQSIFEYAVKELKYSEGQAGRRLQAMRLLKELPEIESDIKEGSLTLSHISQVQSHFRQAQKEGVEFESSSESAESASTSRKKELLHSLKNTSTREAEKIICEMMPLESKKKFECGQFSNL